MKMDLKAVSIFLCVASIAMNIVAIVVLVTKANDGSANKRN